MGLALFFPHGVVFCGGAEPGLVSRRQLGSPLSCHSAVFSVGRGPQCPFRPQCWRNRHLEVPRSAGQGLFLFVFLLGLCAEKLGSTGLSTASGQLAQFSWAA